MFFFLGIDVINVGIYMKKKLLMLRGLIASGKTTFAKQLVLEQPNWCRVNKDDLREMVHAGKWSRDNEVEIINIRNSIIVTALKRGKNVVVDDTGFGQHEKILRELATQNGAEFEIKEFDTPLEVCIERDSKRERPVGKDVIMKMWEKYLKPEPIKYDHSKNKQDVYISDLDGTLAVMSDRSPYDWHKVGNDTVNESVKKTLLSLEQNGYKIIILSGRDGICRSRTEEWLLKNEIPYWELFMRPIGNNEPDDIIKERIFKNDIDPDYNVIAVFDDRDRVVRKWRDLGLTCFQVNYGNF